MAQKAHKRIFPIDERFIPDIFSFKYPKSPWVRLLLFVEMLLAVLVVIGTLLLAVLPRSITFPSANETVDTEFQYAP